jgi:protein-disulfide isomerase
MDKRFWAIVGLIILAFLGLVFFNNNKKTTTVNPTNHVSGKLDSKVTLVEYGDYQCPACQSFSSITQQVREKYKDQIKFQFRNLPLTQIHQNAYAAARAAEAAGKQNKFWEMHDLLYTASNWQAWTEATNANSYFDQYAKQLGLNVTKFKADFKSEAINDMIKADVTEFDKTGEQKATPAYFLNGKKIDSSKLLDAQGQPSLESFSKLIDAALKK